MWVTEEVSLVDFYQSGLRLASEAGYDVVLCFIAREADAPDAYNELIRGWQSIDDLTGPKILFLFAGRSVRSQHQSDNIHRRSSDRVLFSPDVLMLHSKRLLPEWGNGFYGPTQGVMGHFDLRQLQENTEDKHPLFRGNMRPDSRVLARRQPSPPRRGDITASQTSQIRELREFLALREQDIPCLHFTFLDGSPPMHHQVTPKTNVYATLKAIVEAIESQEMKDAKAEISRIRERQATLRQEEQKLESELLNSPEQHFRSTMSLLESTIPLEVDQNNEIQELILALRSHALQPSDESRRAAFDRYRSARAILSGRSDWGAIRSGVQRLIDIVSYSNPIDISTNSERDKTSLEDQKRAVLAGIARERRELELLRREQERRLVIMLAPPGIGARISRAISTRTGAFLHSFVVVAAR
jgi:hypothetical protein